MSLPSIYPTDALPGQAQSKPDVSESEGMPSARSQVPPRLEKLKNAPLPAEPVLQAEDKIPILPSKFKVDEDAQDGAEQLRMPANIHADQEPFHGEEKEASEPGDVHEGSNVDDLEGEEDGSVGGVRELGDNEFEEAITEAFNDFDEDNSGTINAEHLGSVLEGLVDDGIIEEIFDEDELDMLKNDMDADGNGLIPLTEFKDVLTRRRKGPDEDFTNAEIDEAFGVFDHRGTKKITQMELRQVMAAIFETDVPALDARSMIMAASNTGGDAIDLEEFRAILRWRPGHMAGEGGPP